MKIHPFLNSGASLFCFFSVLLTLADAGAADDRVWQGGSGNLTNTPANWVGGNAPQALSGSDVLTPNYNFKFITGSNTTVWLQTGGNSTQYMTQSILFDAGAGAFAISADDGGSKVGEDRFLMLNGATITQNSANDQTINATVLLNTTTAMPDVQINIGGTGSGRLTLNSIRFAANVGTNTRTLYVGRDTTLGNITFTSGAPTGNLRVGEGATVTFSGAAATDPVGDASKLTLQLGINSSGGASSATVTATNASGFATASAVQAYNVTFAGNRQMTFSGAFALQGSSGSRTLNITNAHANGVTLSGVISGSSGVGLAKTGSGLLVFSGANTYTGLTDVQAGTLRLAANDRIANSSAVQVSGGTLDLQNFTDTVGAVTLTGGSIIGTGTLTGSSYVVQSGNVSANLAGSGVALAKTTGGTVTLSGTNLYSGSTMVSGGTLLISGTGTINSTSSVTVNSGGAFRYDSSAGLTRNVTLSGGRFAYNSASNYTGTLTFTSGTVGGTNLSGHALTIGTGQILAPGNSTGALSAGATTWANGGTLQFEINDATGAAGSTSDGWDLFTPASLNITAGVGQFTVQIVSLDDLQASGLAQNFIASNNYQWLIVDSVSPITTFDAAKFVLNTSAFQNFFNGTFSISQGSGVNADKLYLNYTAIPEPSAILLLTGGLMTVFFLRRRTRN